MEPPNTLEEKSNLTGRECLFSHLSSVAVAPFDGQLGCACGSFGVLLLPPCHRTSSKLADPS